MKKVFFVLLLLCANTCLLNAQNNKQDDKWSLTAGPVISLPNKYLHLFHSIGFGADVAAIHPIENGWSAGGRANYTYYFGKGTNSTYAGPIGSHYDATHLFNVLADVNYQFENNLILGVDLGLGLAITSGNTDATLARIAYLAYQLKASHPIIIGAYFDQTNFQKNFGLRFSFQI